MTLRCAFVLLCFLAGVGVLAAPGAPQGAKTVAQRDPDLIDTQGYEKLVQQYRESAGGHVLGDVVRALSRRVSHAEPAGQAVCNAGTEGSRGKPGSGRRFDPDAAVHGSLQAGVSKLPEEANRRGWERRKRLPGSRTARLEWDTAGLLLLHKGRKAGGKLCRRARSRSLRGSNPLAA